MTDVTNDGTTPDDQVQAGAVITPGGAPAAPVVMPEATPTVTASPETPEAEAPTPSPAQSDGETVTWAASEFVAHQKSADWYVKLLAVAVAMAALVYLFTRDIISTTVVLVAALTFGYYATRQPRQLSYELNANGVRIGEKYHDYEEFRSFSLVPEGAFSSIIFMPLKRFAPLTTIYFVPEDEERIIDLLTPRLPAEEYNHDAIDRLMRHIRF